MISDVMHHAVEDIDGYIERGIYGDPSTFKDDIMMVEVIRMREQMIAMRNYLDTSPDDISRLKAGIQHYQFVLTANFEQLSQIAVLRKLKEEER